MTKYNEEDIISFIKQGYRPRVKKVDNIEYMTLRLGNRERSLGRLNPSIEERVNAWYLEHKPAEPKKISEEEKRLLKEKTRVYQEIDEIRDRVKADTCIHNQDMLCTRWRWSRDTLDMVAPNREVYPQKGKSIVDEEGKYVLLKPNSDYCRNCPDYQSNRDQKKPL